MDDLAIYSHLEPSVDAQNELSIEGNTQESIVRSIRGSSTANQLNLSDSINFGVASQTQSTHSRHVCPDDAN